MALTVAEKRIVRQQQVGLSYYLAHDTDGIVADGDYSVTPGEFYIAPSATEIFELYRIIITIQDTVGAAATDYGNITNGLTTGIHIYKDWTGPSGSGSRHLHGGEPIKTNTDWGSLCYDITLHEFGAGDEVLLVRWTFDKDGDPITLHGNYGERFVVQCNDDLTGLTNHRFLVKGRNL